MKIFDFPMISIGFPIEITTMPQPVSHGPMGMQYESNGNTMEIYWKSNNFNFRRCPPLDLSPIVRASLLSMWECSGVIFGVPIVYEASEPSSESLTWGACTASSA